MLGIMCRGAIAVLKREGKPLPPDTGVDASGNVTTDIDQLSSLLPFGRHKGFGLSLLDELYGAYIGGSLPTIRNRWKGAEGGFDNTPADEKQTCTFYFQCTKPDAIGVAFTAGRTQVSSPRDESPRRHIKHRVSIVRVCRGRTSRRCWRT
jgi:hypothetical protein